MSPIDFPAGKIRDAELLERATKEAVEKVSVIIKLELAQQQIEMELRESAKGKPRYAAKGFKEETPEESVEIESRTKAATKFLTDVLDTPPRYLRMARSFAAEVDGKQLRIIAASSLTKSIQPNRRRSKLESSA